jgi:hypothetical protein
MEAVFICVMALIVLMCGYTALVLLRRMFRSGS